jgi:hypothetical protein
MTTNSDRVPVPIDVVAGEGKPYRLWRKHQYINGKPVIVLVHRAVVPMYIPSTVNEFHDPNTINNEKYCFGQLDECLYQNFNYNVFTFGICGH